MILLQWNGGPDRLGAPYRDETSAIERGQSVQALPKDILTNIRRAGPT
jgi:hypothetical protein